MVSARNSAMFADVRVRRQPPLLKEVSRDDRVEPRNLPAVTRPVSSCPRTRPRYSLGTSLAAIVDDSLLFHVIFAVPEIFRSAPAEKLLQLPATLAVRVASSVPLDMALQLPRRAPLIVIVVFTF